MRQKRWHPTHRGGSSIHIYWIAAGITGFFAYLAQEQRKKNSIQAVGENRSLRSKECLLFLLFACCSVVPLLFLASFRYNVGTDYFYTYYPSFYDVVNGLPYEGLTLEPGRWLLCKLVVLLGGGHVWFFTAMVCLIHIPLFIGIYSESESPFLSVLLFVLGEGFFISMNGVAQYIGLAFVFLGFRYVRKQCFWKFALFVLIGTFFHYSTLIFLPLYFLSKIKVRHPWIFILLAAGASFLNGLLKQVMTYVLQHTVYSVYIGSVFQEGNRFYLARLVINGMILLVATWYYYKNNNATRPDYRFFYYLQVLAVFLMMNRNIIPLADRLCWSLEVGQLLFIPMIVHSEKRPRIRAALALVLLGVWGIISYCEVVLLSFHEVIPYQFVYLPGVGFY